MRFSATALAEQLGGRVVGPETELDGVATDTRELRPGQLFVAVRDSRDGHEFIEEALSAGAPAYVTDGRTSNAGTAIVVAHTMRALGDIGRIARAQLGGHVVGVTGSVGKTTVKDLTRGAFASTFRTQASHLSYNNEIGLPMTLANADEDTEVVVAELGARGPGHIADLCRIARPTIGIVTRIGLAHTEFLGSLREVASAKAELVEALPATGLAVLNGDDPFTGSIAARSTAPILLFGLAPSCDIVARDVCVNERAQASFTMATPWGEAELRLSVHGEHQVANALAAATAALWAGAPIAAVAASISQVEDPPGRMNVVSLGPGVTLINDGYNANPTSTEAALRALRAMRADRRIAVLGTMAELGEDSDAMHAAIGLLAQELGITVVGFKTPAYGADAVWDETELMRRLHPLRAGDAVLVKGSKVSGMQRVAATIAQSLDGPPAPPPDRD